MRLRLCRRWSKSSFAKCGRAGTAGLSGCAFLKRRPPLVRVFGEGNRAMPVPEVSEKKCFAEGCKVTLQWPKLTSGWAQHRSNIGWHDPQNGCNGPNMRSRNRALRWWDRSSIYAMPVPEQSFGKMLCRNRDAGDKCKELKTKRFGKGRKPRDSEKGGHHYRSRETNLKTWKQRD